MGEPNNLPLVVDDQSATSRPEPATVDLTGYRAAFELNPLPMVIYDVDSLRFLAVNEAACRHLGRSKEELRWLTVDALHPASGRVAFRRQLVERAAVPISGLHSTHIDTDGVPVHVRVSAYPLQLPSGPARLAIVEDAPAQHQAHDYDARVRRQLADIDYDLTIARLAENVDGDSSS